MEPIEERLAYLRGEIEAERISYSELAELQSLREHIDPGDTLLLEWAGVPEFGQRKLEALRRESVRGSAKELRKRVAQLEKLADELIGELLEVPIDYRELSDPRLMHYVRIVNGSEEGEPSPDLQAGCVALEREITLGGHIGWQDCKWHVFRKCGCSVNEGAASLYELIASLADIEYKESYGYR